jgi:hypothetical protein
MTLEELRSRHLDRIVELAQRRGAHNIRVFGSVARGDQRVDSDVDFLVDFEPGRRCWIWPGSGSIWKELCAARSTSYPAVASGRASSLLSCETPLHYEGRSPPAP